MGTLRAHGDRLYESQRDLRARRRRRLQPSPRGSEQGDTLVGEPEREVRERRGGDGTAAPSASPATAATTAASPASPASPTATTPASPTVVGVVGLVGTTLSTAASATPTLGVSISTAAAAPSTCTGVIRTAAAVVTGGLLTKVRLAELESELLGDIFNKENRDALPLSGRGGAVRLQVPPIGVQHDERRDAELDLVGADAVHRGPHLRSGYERGARQRRCETLSAKGPYLVVEVD